MPPRRCEVDDAASFIDLLKVLVDHEVDFIVVGGVAEILAGSPLVTVRLDVVHAPSRRNLRRLLGVLRKLDARYYDESATSPDISRLAEQERHLFLTDLGLLAVSRSAGGGLHFADLDKKTAEYEVEGFRVRASNLESLIEARKRSSSPEDHYALRFLRQILELTSASVYETAMAS